jgi:hypothetical protein
MFFDTSTVFAGGVASVMAFLLVRGFIWWRRWSKTSKFNDEIKMDKMISDAIKAGDVNLIAQLRKYFLVYKKQKKSSAE